MKEEAYVASRNFSVDHNQVDAPPNIKLATQISNREQGTLIQEATFIAYQAQQLNLPDSDFYFDIVRFLDMRGTEQVKG